MENSYVEKIGDYKIEYHFYTFSTVIDLWIHDKDGNKVYSEELQRFHNIPRRS